MTAIEAPRRLRNGRMWEDMKQLLMLDQNPLVTSGKPPHEYMLYPPSFDAHFKWNALFGIFPVLKWYVRAEEKVSHFTMHLPKVPTISYDFSNSSHYGRYLIFSNLYTFSN